MATAERYAALLRQHNWAVLSTDLNLSDDLLLSRAQDYWGSPGFRNTTPSGYVMPSVLNGPLYNNLNGTITLASSIRFALDDSFRETQMSTPQISN
ncbi:MULTISPECIES: hypothetical protein [Proteus]|nr:hypothetical protein [Proteus columbae]